MVAMKISWLLLLAACGDDGTTATTIDGAPTGCALTAATSATATVSSSGCAVLARDTTACDAARTSAGLTGFWRKFSCRVTLAQSAGTITAIADGLPDYKSNYFAATDACHEDYTAAIQNPNTIKTESYTMGFPATPAGPGGKMQGAVVGLALNGVAIFGNFAAPGDDIFSEAKTFDRCDAHPAPPGNYHYHSEPYAITDDDDSFVGVMRDGSPIYGRRDPDHSVPADLDANGGHTGVTVDSPSTAVYHYHVSLQTSTDARSLNQTAWFLTTGTYHATAGTCTGC